MPALIVALALTFTRSAWVGLVAGVGVLIVLKDRRLLAAIPLVVALTILVAPTSVTARMYSMFDVNDPSNQDRVAMLQSGVEMVRDHPITGVGPDMVKSVYREYRQPWAVNDLNVHLHNVPVQIAAERGLPALADLDRVHRSTWRATCSGACTHQPSSLARRRRTGRGRGDARRRAVRVQLRGLRVPDALPGAHHAALRVGPHRRRRRRAMTADAAASSLAALRSLVARTPFSSPIGRSSSSATSCSISSRSGACSASRPEAPVPVVEHIGDEVRLGGAANVAHNIRALGATPRLIGLVGAGRRRGDAAGGARRRPASPPTALIEDAARPTTRKVRIVTTRHQQVARVDYESDAEAGGDIERALIAAVDRAAADAAVVVVSDYLKGAVTPALMRRLAERRAATGLAVLVDPKIPHLAYYAGASLITPNHHEAEVATHTRIRTDDDARDAARAFRALAGATSVMITRGEHGLWLAEGAAPAAGARRTRRRSASRPTSPPRRARSPTSPAPATPSSPRWRSRSPPAPRCARPPSSPTTPRASRSASSAPPP